MIIRVKDTIKKRNKDGKYDEQLIDRCVIFGQKYKFEEHVSKKGNSYACRRKNVLSHIYL